MSYKQTTSIRKEENELLYRKIDSITKTCTKQYFNKILKKLASVNKENVNIIYDYITAEETELNIKNSTKESRIKVLVWLSNFYKDTKSFRDMTKQQILEYLNSLRKPLYEDSTQRWIGSYNGRQIIFSKFFRWLYNPDEPDHRKRMTPQCMKGIKQLPRKEKTPYKPSDLWEERENAIFLKYCPSIRDRCYHAMANDMSARPSEILNLKIKDVVFKKTDDGKQYAEVVITGGKTKPRTIPLIDSIPYVKDLINNHPSGTNPDSWLFLSKSNTTFGAKLTYDGLTYQYKYFYMKRHFPKLLEDETVPESDKSLIRNMLTKPWNLYVLRHSALTEKSKILKENLLRDHAGWTTSSNMPQFYIHYFGNESSKSLLQAKGIIKQTDLGLSNILKSKQCPNCQEPNKPDSLFCIKCKMVLSYGSYNETIEKQTEKEDRLIIMQNKINFLEESVKEVLECLKDPEKLLEIVTKEKLASN